MKTKLFVVSLCALLVLSACAQANDQMVAPTEAPAVDYGYDDKNNSTATEAEIAGAAVPGAEEQSKDRLVIRRAEMEVAVVTPEDAMAELSALANSMGGYVVFSNSWSETNPQGITFRRASITVRVPAERLEEVMAKVRLMSASGKDGIISESVSGEDVTSDYVDSQSRLRNLEAAEAQLTELLDNTTDLDATLKVFNELTRVREEIEVLEGHIKYLEESSALSSLTVSFVAEASVQPIEIAGWKPEGTAKKAVQQLIVTLQAIGSGLIWFGIYCLPFLIPLGLVVYFIVKGAKKRKEARKIESEAVAPEAEKK